MTIPKAATAFSFAAGMEVSPECGRQSASEGHQPRLPSLPRLMLVTDGAATGHPEGLEKIRAAVRGGVGIVQLRDRAASAADLLARARLLRSALPGTVLLINDRIDVALAAGADGVQLGAGALPVPEARRLLGPSLGVGRSVHSVPEAEAAAENGADFLIVGTIYETATHPGREPSGPALLKDVKRAVQLPLFAIGGITADNAPDCIRHGAHGVAVIRAIIAAGDPEAATCQILASIEGV